MMENIRFTNGKVEACRFHRLSIGGGKVPAFALKREMA
jgi:hypothetical protein